MTAAPEGLSVHVVRVLPAPRRQVFAMHVDPLQLRRWWGPKGFTAPSIELDLRVGGAYRIAMQPPEGVGFFLAGDFRQIEPPEVLAYTFLWEPPDPDDRETLVVISLRDLGDSTELIVEHGQFATVARRDLHEQGWNESLDRLHDVLMNDHRLGR